MIVLIGDVRVNDASQRIGAAALYDARTGCVDDEGAMTCGAVRTPTAFESDVGEIGVATRSVVQFCAMRIVLGFRTRSHARCEHAQSRAVPLAKTNMALASLSCVEDVHGGLRVSAA